MIFRIFSNNEIHESKRVEQENEENMKRRVDGEKVFRQTENQVVRDKVKKCPERLIVC